MSVRSRTTRSTKFATIPILVILGAIGFIWMFANMILFHPSMKSDVDKYLHFSRIPCSEQHQEDWDRVSSSFSEYVGDGSLSCRQVKEYVDQGLWQDPNEGKIYARRLVTEPHFYVAVHNHSYDFVRWEHIFEKGKYYEDLVHDRFVEILSHHPSSLVVDVGANIGYYTLLSLALGHNVIGFEINPANLLRLCESLRLNGWKNAAIFQRGVSNTDGTRLQVLVPKNPGQAFMKELDAANDTPNISAHHAFTTTVTLDTFASERGWFDKANLTISILKLDVEGKEPQIVEGAKKLLRSGIVANVLTEARRIGRPTIQQELNTLLSSGYTIVHEKEGKVSRERARVLLDDLEKEMRGKMKNVDLWFQRE